MTRGWWRLPVLLVSAPLVVGACSSSTGAGTSAVQTYLSAVNRLCDALLPEVIAVTHGGSLDVPVKKYRAQRPEHAKLLAGFDRKLARIPVPPASASRARRGRSAYSGRNRSSASTILYA